MKLSQSTLAILKNFATINQGLIIRPGNILATISKARSVVGFAEIAEEFPVECQIYDVSKFLQVLSVFDEPEIDWKDTFCVIKSGRTKLKYGYGEGVEPEPPRKVKERSFDGSFTMTEEDLGKMIKMSKILEGMDRVSFTLDGEHGDITLQSSEGPNRNEYGFEVSCECDESVTTMIQVDDLTVLPLQYVVDVSESVIRLTNEEQKLWYLIAASSED